MQAFYLLTYLRGFNNSFKNTPMMSNSIQSLIHVMPTQNKPQWHISRYSCIYL